MSEAVVIFIASVIIALIGWAISLLLRIGDKVTKMDQWRAGHEEAHDAEKEINSERHNSNYRALIEIRREIHNALFRKWRDKDDDE